MKLDWQLQPFRCGTDIFERGRPKKRLPKNFLQSVLGGGVEASFSGLVLFVRHVNYIPFGVT
jgi:hypothetical protein